MNANQQALISIIARHFRIRPEEVTPATKLGYSSEAIATRFAVLHDVSIQVGDVENCTVNDLLQQLA